ncbi:monocarboxylate transporter 6-like [Erpetoichthys calabaricus]|uniref:monocarboxylate transporter 6-like n=1 Tax=Erpetoichthys calabaricus TaxID=27687 RepID=UPI002234D323|nr:monocarboxylate transporter 6-like [Erpetoichthys calabaricus]
MTPREVKDPVMTQKESVPECCCEDLQCQGRCVPDSLSDSVNLKVTSGSTFSEEEPVPAEKFTARQPLAPDGGWGWVVVLATILILALTLAFPSCLGIFYTDLQNQFQASNSETSWVPSIMTAVLHAGGPLCSILVEHYGCRFTVMLGGILSGIGMAASSFSQTIGQLYLTAGFITGFGFCLSFQPSITIMGHYFVRRRPLANALASTGTALGLSTLPVLAQYLLSHMGWRGSFLIFGGILLNCCVCGAVMRPLLPRKRKEVQSQSHKQITGKKDKMAQVEAKKMSNGLPSHVKHNTGRKLASFTLLLQKYMAFDLFCRNKRYQIYAVGVTWMMLGFVVPLVYLVPYATTYGMEQSKAALLLAILGFINIFMRPLAGLISGHSFFSGKYIYVFSFAVLINGLSDCICVISASFNVLLVYVVAYGISMSFIGSLLFQVLMDTVEIQRFPSALGLVTIMESVTILIGPPLTGLIVDTTLEYKYVFYACSAAVASSAVFMGVSTYLLEGKESKISTTQDHSPVFSPECQYTGMEQERVLVQRRSTETIYITSV